MFLRAIAALAAASLFTFAQNTASPSERPLALVTSSSGAQVKPANRSLPVTLVPGDLLYNGDTVLTEQGEAALAFCPRSAIFSLSKGGRFTIAADEIRGRDGSTMQKASLPACELPELDPASVRSVRELARGSDSPVLTADPTTDLAANIDSLTTLVRSLKDLPGVRRRGLVHDLKPIVRDVSTVTPEEPLGPTYALVVGISKYQKLSKDDWLVYADKDAASFAEYLGTQRGGELDLGNRMRLLTNEEATKDAVRDYIRLYLEKARETHGTFVLVLGAHGVSDDQTGDATIVTHESNPEDLYTSGVPMDELQEMLSEGLTGIGRMLVYVDVCHAAKIGTIKTKNVNRAVKRELIPPTQVPGRILSLVSSGETEESWEGQNWGGGHGAFTYFLLRGLNGDADSDGNGVVDARELVTYVQTMVQQSTLDAQHPLAQSFTLGNAAPMADIGKNGMSTLSERWSPLTKDQVSRKRGLSSPGDSFSELQESSLAPRQDLADFRAAILAGKLLPGDPNGAFEILRTRLQPLLSATDYRTAATDLRVALENRGQETILRYLEGDQVQQVAESYRASGEFFRAAQILAPDSGAIESRALFSRGRELIFSRSYDDAVRYLEQATTIDPRGAYSFNALGIAYLEQVQNDPTKFDLAVAAFQDAIRLAPRWAYPRHNLALAYGERGQYQIAMRTYREAMQIAPDYSYLPYNLGLLYQRTNRLDDAQRSYQNALRIAQRARDSGSRPAPQGQWQEGSDILNALGSIEAARKGRGHREAAERYYRQAIAENTSSHPARHNLATLLSASGESAEAEQLWRANLAEAPDESSSRLALADYLDRVGRTQEAAVEYERAIGGDAFPGIRRKLAAIYVKLSRPDDARRTLEVALADAPQNPALLEDLGDVESRGGNRALAEQRYQAAAAQYRAGADRKRVRQKLAALAR